MKRRTMLAASAAAVLVAGFGPASTGAAAAADALASKTIRIVVPYAAGGLPDMVARIVGQRLQESLGRSVVIDNRLGGNGGVAAAALAASPPDGHTLLVTDGSLLTINRLLPGKLGYDPDKDFAPVSLIARSPLFLAVSGSVPAKSLDELVALARAKGDALTYGSSGVGSSHHLTAEAFNAGFATSITHIPYKGSANSVPAMIGGQVDMVFAAYPSLAGFMKSGQVRILATSGARRSSFAPDVPAIAEKLPGFDFPVQVIMLAPRATPPEIVHRLGIEVARAVQRPDTVEQMRLAGIEPVGGGPEQMEAAIRAELQRVAVAARRAGLKAE